MTTKSGYVHGEIDVYEDDDDDEYDPEGIDADNESGTPAERGDGGYHAFMESAMASGVTFEQAEADWNQGDF
jgi:hypothetical protein